MGSPSEQFALLRPHERGILSAAASPAAIIAAAVALVAGAGWGLVLAHWSIVASATPEAAALFAVGRELPAWLSGLCGALSAPDSAAASPAWLFLAALAMWWAMTLAMMLPAAAPMLTTYAQIAETAIARGRKLVSVVTLAAGFIAAWFAFALVAAGLQTLLLRAGLLGGARADAVPWLAGLLLLAAGLFQFTALKQACLVKCRTPFGFFMTNWRESAAGVFALGLRQGIFCIGCCWALMAAMFAAGAMNPFWMLLLAAIMISERMTRRGHLFRQASGAALSAAGLAVLGWAFAA